MMLMCYITVIISHYEIRNVLCVANSLAIRYLLQHNTLLRALLLLTRAYTRSSVLQKSLQSDCTTVCTYASLFYVSVWRAVTAAVTVLLSCVLLVLQLP
jgi:hypothetical protein